jgi:hypothetical protein
MKNIRIFLILIFSTAAFAHKEGQSFCDGVDSESYFTFLTFEKILVWFGSYYIEKLEGEKVINGKTYKVYVQEWKEGNKDSLYFREEGTKVLQYNETTKKDKIRFDSTFKIGQQWESDGIRYKLLSHNEKLLTPVCDYRNLMAIEATYPKSTYIFYYLKGFGYVGATKEGKLVSCAVPNLEVIDEWQKKRGSE